MSVALKMLFLQLVCILVVSVKSDKVSPSNLPVGYTYIPYYKTGYKIHLDQHIYDDAKAACVAEGGRLALIDTARKLAFLKGLKPPKVKVLVGIKYDDVDRYFKTAHENIILRWESLPWAAGQPSGRLGDFVETNEDATGLEKTINHDPQPYVCEVLTSS